MFILIQLMEWFFHRLPNSFMVKPKIFLFLLYYIEINGIFCHNYCLFQCMDSYPNSFFFFSYPNSDSKFVAYIFIHSSKEAANSIKISVPTLLLPPLKRVPYMILCSSSTELTRRKHKTSIVEVFTAHWKSACWKVMYTLRSIS